MGSNPDDRNTWDSLSYLDFLCPNGYNISTFTFDTKFVLQIVNITKTSKPDGKLSNKNKVKFEISSSKNASVVIFQIFV